MAEFRLKKFINNLLYKAVPDYGSAGAVNPFAIIMGRQHKIASSEAMQYYSGWVYACIRAIAEEIAGNDWSIYKKNAKGDITELIDDPVVNLLHAPNSYQTGYDLLYNIVAHLETTGNAFIFLGDIASDREKPTTLQLLNPANTKVKRAAFPDFISGYTYYDGDKINHFNPYQVLHIKYNDPADPYEGIGTVQAGIKWINSEIYQTEYNLRYFKNGARIGGFLESERAQTPEQLEYLKRSFEKAATGLENSHKTLALPKGTTYKEGSTNQKDMDFYNGQIVLRDKILAIFRVPKTVLGVTDDVNRANAEATNYVFALRTIKPKLRLIAQYFNEFLLPRFDNGLYFEFENPVPEDKAQQLEEMKAAIGGQPTMSVNEARQEFLGLDPVKGGENVMTNFNLVPLGTPEPAPTPAKGMRTKGFKIYKNRFEIKDDKKKSIANDIVSAVKEVFEEASKERKQEIKSLGNLSRKEFEPIYKAFAARVTPYEKKQEQIMKTFNSRIQKEVLENVEKATKSRKKAVDANTLFDETKAVALLVDLSKPNFYDLYEKEGAAAAALIGFDNIEMLTPEARKALDNSLSLLSESYNDTTKALLKTKLEAGMKEGMGVDELKRTVREVFDYSDEVRAKQVATTETFRIANTSTKDAWKNTGVVKSIKWYTAEDDTVCEYCGPMDGKVISIEDNFFDKGQVAHGSDGGDMNLDYSDVGSPPLHVSCRCYQRPEDISLD